MKELKVETYYYNGKEVIRSEQEAFIINERLYVGGKKIEYQISDINYEIRDINDIPTLLILNPMFRKIAIDDFEQFLFHKTELYKQLKELKELTEK